MNDAADGDDGGPGIGAGARGAACGRVRRRQLGAQRNLPGHLERRVGADQRHLPRRGQRAQHLDDQHDVQYAGRMHGPGTSELGWSADVGIHGSEYVLKRDIFNWEPCPDGAARTGHQIYRFYPVDQRGWVTVGSNVLAGVDKTSGDSGACGINKALVITMPFRLEKIG